MNYPYPIPGGPPTVVTGFKGPYFNVGNECCNGCMSNDFEAITKVMFDYTSQLSTGVNVTDITYSVSSNDVNQLTVSDSTLAGNIATFMVSRGTVGASYVVEALATLDNGEMWVDRITVSVTECCADGNAPFLLGAGPVILSKTLYYIASAGQTLFNLSTPDVFGQVGIMDGNNVLVYVDGDRKVPITDYTIDAYHNQIILVAPATAGESVIIDLVEMIPTPIPTPPLGNISIFMESLTIIGLNVLSPLTFIPDGSVLMLFINGMAFFPVGPDTAFSMLGKVVVWSSATFSIAPGAAVVAVYTHV